jgi:hypothetical protein
VTYTSQFDLEDPDGSIHKLRVLWIDEGHANSTMPHELDCLLWRAFRVTDADTGEELQRVSANRFQSDKKGRCFTIAPKRTEPGGHP